MDGNVGYIIQKDSPLLTAMRMCFQKVCEQYSWNGAIDLTMERGVYNLNVQVAGGDGSVERAVDVSRRRIRPSCIGWPANGLAEVGVREVKAQTRVLKSHLKKRLK